MHPYLSTSKRVHLDFHTPGFIENVAGKFDTARYAETLYKAGIQAIAAFAKCHYGNAYYPTKIGTVNPGLHYDLLGAMTTACKARSIRVAAYYSLGFDNNYCEAHPDQQQVGMKGPFPIGHWRVPCLSTPYGDFAKSQIEEIAGGYPVDGLWFDIVGYYPLCLCESCLKRYREDVGEAAIGANMKM